MEYTGPVGEPPDAVYITGNPAADIKGSIVPGPAIEHPQREIVHAIEQAGLVPDPLDLTQLYQAIAALIAAAGGPQGGRLVGRAEAQLAAASTNSSTTRTASGLAIGYAAVAAANPRLVTAVLEHTTVDNGSGGSGSRCVLEYFDGTNWVDLDVATHTVVGPNKTGRSSLVLRVWHDAPDPNAQYRITHFSSPLGTESSTIGAGSALFLEEYGA